MLAALLPYATPVAVAAASVPAELVRAALVAENDHRGIIAYQVTWDSEARGGPMHQRFHYRNIYAYDGERFLAARAIEKMDNGHTAGAQELEAQTKKIAREEGRGATGFAVPFDSRHFNEYRYVALSCATCRSGETSIGFTSPLLDVNHGGGFMIVDRGSHVRHLQYTPNVMPSFGPIHAREAMYQIERAGVLPGFWATVKIENRFGGRYGFIRGLVVQSVTFDRYRRFGNDAAAIAAIRFGNL